MSKLRIQKLDLKSFKAFLDLSVPINGRNLLVYGKNGAGKSSIYWALYTFLQSAQKQSDDVFKYFDAALPENLINRYTTAPNDASIAVSFQKEDGVFDSAYTISKTLHETKAVPKILNGDLASDFITYRILFSFYHYRHRQTIDLWQVFEDEMLPFCQGDSVKKIYALWVELREADPFAETQAAGEIGYATFRRYNRFDVRVSRFNRAFQEVLARITTEAQAFYDKHFADPEEANPDMKLMLGVSLASPAEYDRESHTLVRPSVSFEVKIGVKPLHKPHSFLNEAKLTQLALSIRFGATLAQLQESPIKLLVLDDLLISLDMSNRMKVVKIILGEDFADYQKVILTHDLGFFQEIRREIGAGLHHWQCSRIAGSATEGRRLENAKSELDQAKDFLSNDQLSECGNKLRQHVEAALTTFLEQAREKKGLDHLIDREAFASLHQKLNEASSELSLNSFHQFAQLLQSKFSPEQLKDVASPDEIDATKFNHLTNKRKGAVIAKLYAARADLQQNIIEVLSDASRHRLTAIKLLEDVRRIKDRILNPASHAGAAPLYTQEAEDAIKVIQALDAALTAALSTL
jgi:hypothetical protein